MGKTMMVMIRKQEVLRIEDSRDKCLEDQACRSCRTWGPAIEMGGSKSLILSSAIHSLMHSLRKVSGSTEELGGGGEGLEDIVGKIAMVVIRVREGMFSIKVTWDHERYTISLS
jgi:hypothetical protein